MDAAAGVGLIQGEITPGNTMPWSVCKPEQVKERL